jgi:hypothetical protein
MKYYIYLIIAVKIAFVMLAIAGLYYKAKGVAATDTKVQAIQFWKERTEFIFIFLMSAFMLYLFYPRATTPRPLNYETRLLLYLFGIILLITADWGTFFHESPALKHIQSALSTSKRF